MGVPEIATGPSRPRCTRSTDHHRGPRPLRRGRVAERTDGTGEGLGPDPNPRGPRTPGHGAGGDGTDPRPGVRCPQARRLRKRGVVETRRFGSRSTIGSARRAATVVRSRTVCRSSPSRRRSDSRPRSTSRAATSTSPVWKETARAFWRSLPSPVVRRKSGRWRHRLASYRIQRWSYRRTTSISGWWGSAPVSSPLPRSSQPQPCSTDSAFADSTRPGSASGAGSPAISGSRRTSPLEPDR